MPSAIATPADTTMMSVVHDALRRDFSRLLDVLPDSHSLASGRATALAEHVTWMIGFLHHHHQSEDDGLWPLLLAKDPQAATLIEEMESDHRVISPRWPRFRRVSCIWCDRVCGMRETDQWRDRRAGAGGGERDRCGRAGGGERCNAEPVGHVDARDAVGRYRHALTGSR